MMHSGAVPPIRGNPDIGWVHLDVSSGVRGREVWQAWGGEGGGAVGGSDGYGGRDGPRGHRASPTADVAADGSIHAPRGREILVAHRVALSMGGVWRARGR